MQGQTLEFLFFLIFTGAAVMATASLYLRQAMIIGYIFLGLLLGPWGLAYINDPQLVEGISNIGIIFLLYLLGLDLLPQQLWKMLGEAMTVTLVSALVFFMIGAGVGLVFGYAMLETVLIGMVMTFSSTIIGLKLLPTTTLHHKHTGQIIISILLIQDLLAIILLLFLQGYGKEGNLIFNVGMQLLNLPILILIAWLLEKYVLEKLIMRFDQIHEYIFLLAIAWCLGMAELAHLMGLSHEIGAFIAGVALASSPIALFITDNLKPLRDFFLIIFFFSLGAGFNMSVIDQIIIPAALLAAILIVVKPLVFRWLLNLSGEKDHISKEVGFRLGQASEFSLLVAVLAVQSGFIPEITSYLIQLTTLLTFIVSSCLIVLSYPTPISTQDRLRRD